MAYQGWKIPYRLDYGVRKMSFGCRLWYLARTLEKYMIVAVMIVASIGDGGPNDCWYRRVMAAV